MRGVEAIAARVEELLARRPELARMAEDIRGACALLIERFEAGGKLLACGNGGSAADAEHIVGELMKGFARARPLGPELRGRLEAVDADMGGRLAASLQSALPAIALTGHAALSSAFSNDVDPALVFAQQVLGYGRAGDVLLAISTSGRAANVLHAAVAARALGLKVIGLTGEGGGELAALCDICLSVPERETWKAQELHQSIYHAACLAIEAAFFAE
jgi:D-sedoheptulose 7-phosphate isomerase